jgi:hypothetical protein
MRRGDKMPTQKKSDAIATDALLLACAVEVKNRFARAAYETTPIRVATAFFRSFLKGDLPTAEIQRLMASMEEPLMYLYPAMAPWKQPEVNDLVSRMCDILDEIASGKPVHRDPLTDVQLFCSEVASNYRLALSETK